MADNPTLSIAITGSSGLLGANLVVEFSRLGHFVTALYGEHPVAFPSVRSAACDLTDPFATSRLLAAVRPSWIVHCAAATNVDWCEAHPEECLRINAQASGWLARIARSLDARFLYVSTDAVFDGASGGYREEDPVSPVNQYARAKAAGEVAVLREASDALILRTNIYGWNLQPKHSLAEWALARLEAEQSVPGFGDVTFSPVLVNDLAQWMLSLMQSNASGIFHVGSADLCSKHQFLRQTADIFHMNAALVRETRLAESGLTAPRPRHTWLRVDKIAAALGHSMPAIRDGLEHFRRLREDGLPDRLKAGRVPEET